MESRKDLSEENVPAIKRRPLRIDFLLVAANVIEKNAILNVFEFPYTFHEGKIQYLWGELTTPKENQFNVTIALIWLRDDTGSTPAIENAREAVPLLCPSFLFDVGIVAGASTRETKVSLGDIIIANIIHHGATGKDESIREGRSIIQPSTFLKAAAENVGLQQIWKTQLNRLDEELSLKPTEPTPDGEDVKNNWHFVELVSADKMAKPNEPYVKANQKKYKNAAAFEMEAGAIASVLHNLNDLVHSPGFLFVKGVSDIVGDGDDNSALLYELDESVKKGSKERETWRRYAAHAAAIFTREIILNMPIEFLRPAYHSRVWPLYRRASGIHIQTGNIGTFGHVEPRHYSKLSSDILADIAGKDGHAAFFTVCAYSPSALWQIFAESQKKKPDQVSVQEQYEIANEEFDHFKSFINYSNRHNNSVRILFLDGKEPSEDEWKLFLLLNGNLSLENLSQPSWDNGVQCWVIEREELIKKRPQERFLTDYVILGEEILVDYYQDSGVLCISELTRHACGDYYLCLRDYFRRTHKNHTSKFTSLSEKHKQLETKFQGGTS